MSGEIDAKTDQVKGRVKQAAGDLTDNDRLRREGKLDEVAGELKEKAGATKDKVKDAIDDAKDAVKDRTK